MLNLVVVYTKFICVQNSKSQIGSGKNNGLNHNIVVSGKGSGKDSLEISEFFHLFPLLIIVVFPGADFRSVGGGRVPENLSGTKFSGTKFFWN